MFSEAIQERILEALKSNSFGLTLCEASALAETQRITARKHLERLSREGRVKEVRKGRCRIFALVEVSGV